MLAFRLVLKTLDNAASWVALTKFNQYLSKLIVWLVLIGCGDIEGEDMCIFSSLKGFFLEKTGGSLPRVVQGITGCIRKSV